MIKKLSFAITSILFSAAVFVPAIASAVPNKHADLPTEAGTYTVPGHSNLRLRVSVYHARGGNKPSPSPAPETLVCGLQDPASSTADNVTGWHLPAGDWTYRLNPGSVPSTVTSSEFVQLSSNAFGAWNSATDVDNSVNFVRGANTSVNRSQLDGQNVITWGRTSGTALATTYTWYYTSSHEVAEVDTIINQKFAWNWADQSDSAKTGCAYDNYYDTQNILTHELGHWLGLDDDYDNTYTENTMYGYGSKTEIKKNTPAAGDIATVNSLY